MKISKKLLIFFILILSIAILSSCGKNEKDINNNDNNDQPEIITQEDNKEKPKEELEEENNEEETEIETKVDLVLKKEINTIDEAITNQVNDYIPFNMITEADLPSHNNFLESIGVTLSESEKLLQTYGIKSQITTSNITETTVDINIKVPYLLKIYLDKAESCETEEELNAAVNDAILSEDYEVLDKTFTLKYTKDEDGNIKIEETYEFVDTIYGGMQSFLDIMTQVSIETMNTMEGGIENEGN